MQERRQLVREMLDFRGKVRRDAETLRLLILREREGDIAHLESQLQSLEDEICMLVEQYRTEKPLFEKRIQTLGETLAIILLPVATTKAGGCLGYDAGLELSHASPLVPFPSPSDLDWVSEPRLSHSRLLLLVLAETKLGAEKAKYKKENTQSKLDQEGYQVRVEVISREWKTEGSAMAARASQEPHAVNRKEGSGVSRVLEVGVLTCLGFVSATGGRQVAAAAVDQGQEARAAAAEARARRLRRPGAGRRRAIPWSWGAA